MGGKKTIIPFRSLDNRGTGTVAEQDAGVAVGPVDDPRQDLGADYEHLLCITGANIFVCNGKAVDKTGTGRGKVKCGCVDRPEFVLHDAGGCRKGKIGGNGSENDQIEFFGLDAGHLQCPP